MTTSQTILLWPLFSTFYSVYKLNGSRELLPTRFSLYNQQTNHFRLDNSLDSQFSLNANASYHKVAAEQLQNYSIHR